VEHRQKKFGDPCVENLASRRLLGEHSTELKLNHIYSQIDKYITNKINAITVRKNRKHERVTKNAAYGFAV
jgi:hypothetical protein